jgi:aminopeptidase N
MSEARPARAAAALALALPVALSCAGAGPAPAAPPSPAGARPLVHHDAQVTLVPARRAVLVEDEVTLSPELRARLGDQVVFTLHAGLSPERAGPGAPLARAERGPALRGDRDGGAARVPVEHFAVELAPGERSFTIRYGGEIFHPIEEKGEEYARKMSESPGLVTAEGAVLSGATRWLPELSDGLVNFTLDVRVPPDWEAVSQGSRAGHERAPDGVRVRWDSPEPQEEAFLVAGPLVEHARLGFRVPVFAFLRTDDAALAERYLSAAIGDLAMYERLLGPYPYAKFALIENFWETGYGMPSFTLLGPRILRLPFIVHTSYPHEILHDWWGNGVFVDAARGNWCEGLTAYLADHLVAEQSGRGDEYRRTALQRFTDFVAEGRDFPVSAFRARSDSVTQAVGYDKVLMIFHMLRERLGDERFVGALRTFYAEYRFREASFTDLARVMGAAAGEDLSPWFAQWLDRPGAPALRVEQARVVSRGGAPAVELTLAQTQAGEPYALDVPVALTLPSMPHAVRRTVRVTERRQTVTLPLDAAPSRLDVDPELDVFRRLDPGEIPPALSGAFGAAQRVLVLPSAAPPPLAAAYRALAEAWKAAGVEITTDAALTRLPAGKSVWVLGWENRLRGAAAEALAPYGATLGERELRASQATLPRDRRSVVAVGRSPADPAQVVAFLGADRAAALPGLARKLPHYGRYGLLGFEGDEPAAVTRETWAILASPMAVGLLPGPLPPRAPLPPRHPLAEPPPPPPRG